MKRTMLAMATVALLAGTSSMALAQVNMPGTNDKNTTSTTNNQPGSQTNATMRGNVSGKQARMSPDKVKEIQSALDQKGQHVTVDGHWGKQTASALRNFQKENGLPATGRLDPETAEKLGLPPSG